MPTQWARVGRMAVSGMPACCMAISIIWFAVELGWLPIGGYGPFG